MDSLPQEVVAAIFRWSVTSRSFPSDHCDLAIASLPTDIPPINLSQVCKAWRQIALSDGYLWSFLHINAAMLSPRDTLRLLSRTQTWLNRSSASFAPLTFDVATGAGFDALTVTDAIFEQLRFHQNRWKDVTIRCSDFTGVIILPELYDLPVLETMNFVKSFAAFPVSLYGERIQVDLSGSPRLRQYTLVGFDELTSIYSDVVLTNLTAVVLKPSDPGIANVPRFPGVEDCIQVFQFAPRLEEFQASIGREDRHPITKEVIRLEHLRSLRISWRVQQKMYFAHLLDKVRAPSLKILSINFGEGTGHEEQAIDNLHDFISRSEISLEDLDVTSVYSNVNTTSVLRLSPRLKQLSLCCQEIPNEVLDGLSEKFKDKDERIEFSLCPRLESLFLDSFHCDCLEEEDFRIRPSPSCHGRCGVAQLTDVIACRWVVPVSQRTLETAYVTGERSKGYGPLESMVSEGLKIEGRLT